MDAPEHEPAPPPAPPPSRWRRRLAVAAAGFVVGALGAYVGIQVSLRHVPWSVPAGLRPPAAPPVDPAKGGLWVRWLGVSGYEVTDGRTVILLDPTLTRPGGLELLAPLESDEALVAAHVERADAILVNHTHHDHALDVPTVARRTGAPVLATRSTLNLCRSRGVPDAQLREARPGDRLTVGTFTIDVRASRHTAIAGVENPMSGVVAPDAGPLRFWGFKQDGCLIFRLSAGGTTLWFHPTSTYDPGDLGGLEAANIILGVTGEPLTLERARGVLAESRARRVLPTHYDNFFHPLSKGLALLPTLDLDAALAAIDGASPGVPVWMLDFGQTVHLPPD